MNPFKHNEIDHDHLYNLATGKPISDDVANFLLNIQTVGNNETFIDECAQSVQSVTRFEKPIKQNKVLNFVSANTKKKMAVNNEALEVRLLLILERNLFGHLLIISLTENIDT